MSAQLKAIPLNTPSTLKEKKKSKKTLSNQTINVFRTTQRGNIDLTAIADNKASVLLSLNALIITFMTPMIVAHSEMVFSNFLQFPLIILGLTCMTTIVIAAQVLKPSHFDKVGKEFGDKHQPSPFFFGNFHKMSGNDFLEFTEDALTDTAMLKKHLAQDIYFVGKRLGDKMLWIRRAFNIFTIGVSLTLICTAVVLWLV